MSSSPPSTPSPTACGNSPYAVAKSGVESLGRSLRAELAPLAPAPPSPTSAGSTPNWSRTPSIRRTRAASESSAPTSCGNESAPDEAGAGLVRGIEERAPRVFVAQVVALRLRPARPDQPAARPPHGEGRQDRRPDPRHRRENGRRRQGVKRALAARAGESPTRRARRWRARGRSRRCGCWRGGRRSGGRRARRPGSRGGRGQLGMGDAAIAGEAAAGRRGGDVDVVGECVGQGLKPVRRDRGGGWRRSGGRWPSRSSRRPPATGAGGRAPSSTESRISSLPRRSAFCSERTPSPGSTIEPVQEAASTTIGSAPSPLQSQSRATISFALCRCASPKPFELQRQPAAAAGDVLGDPDRQTGARRDRHQRLDRRGRRRCGSVQEGM